MINLDDGESYEPGTFQIEGGVIRVTDPCYCPTPCPADGDSDHERDEGVLVVPALNGVWHSELWIVDCGGGGRRVAQLRACHESMLEVDRDEQEAGTVYVDSGQMGIFDDSRFPRDPAQFEYGDESSFYKRACNLTWDDENPMQPGGCLPFGTVSRTGFGDGAYEVSVLKDPTGLALSVSVQFLYEEEDGEDSYDDDGDEVDEEEEDDEEEDDDDEPDDGSPSN